jgi:hypothetical protein
MLNCSLPTGRGRCSDSSLPHLAKSARYGAPTVLVHRGQNVFRQSEAQWRDLQYSRKVEILSPQQPRCGSLPKKVTGFDRSVAKWRDLLFLPSSNHSHLSSPSPLVVLSAKPRDLQCALRFSQILSAKRPGRIIPQAPHPSRSIQIAFNEPVAELAFGVVMRQKFLVPGHLRVQRLDPGSLHGE